MKGKPSLWPIPCYEGCDLDFQRFAYGGWEPKNPYHGKDVTHGLIVSQASDGNAYALARFARFEDAKEYYETIMKKMEGEL